MKLLLLFLLIACTVMDTHIAPTKLNQMRLLMKMDGVTEVGLHGSPAPSTLLIRAYGKGSIKVQGKEGCGYIFTKSFDKSGWVSVDLREFPISEYCSYDVQMDIKGYDDNISGRLLIANYKNPNIEPLEITTNGVKRSGVNFVQVAESLGTEKGGISESNSITLHLGGHTGELEIGGCGMSVDKFPYEGDESWTFSLPELYKHIGKIDRACVFKFVANHDDAIKQMGVVLVNVYKDSGEWLAAPMEKDGCFNFTDEYVVKVIVNDKETKCDKKAERWIVEGITSKGRMFYGEYVNGEWEIQK